MRILVVDDHQLFIDGIRHIITSLDKDIEILEATSADHARQHLDASSELDLVLLDLRLPDIDGLQVLERLKAERPEVCVVILTSYGSLGNWGRLINYGTLTNHGILTSYGQPHDVTDRVLRHVGVAVEVAGIQIGAEAFELVHFGIARAIGADHRNAALQKGTGEVQPGAPADAGDQDRIAAHGLRNSARVWMLSMKHPPSAVVLVCELPSITPRDFTQ